MSLKILVAYATRAGSTAEIATEVGGVLSARGFSVEMKSLKERPVLAGYQAVVLGSAVRMGSWLPEALTFVRTNQRALQGLPVALFTVHMLNTGEDEASRTARAGYTASVRALLPDASEAFFAGLMDFSRLSFFDRFIARMVKAVESDRRDWGQIRDWAGSVFSGVNAL